MTVSSPDLFYTADLTVEDGECCDNSGKLGGREGPVVIQNGNKIRWSPSRRVLSIGFCGLFWALAIAVLFLFLVLFGKLESDVDLSCRRYAVDMLQISTARCSPPSKALVDDTGRKVHRVCFIGDSLTSDANARTDFIHNIVLRLRATYPQLAFDAVEAGHGGNTISDINKRLVKECLAYSPDAVIFYWDSDVSDLPKEYLERTSVQNTYYNAVSWALQTVRAASVSRVAVAGPTLLGEMPDGHNIIPYDKDALLDTFVGLNEKACSAVNAAVQPPSALPWCTYVHTRRAFLDQDKRFEGTGLHGEHPSDGLGQRQYPFPSGYLTIDGEHHSSAGIAVVEKLFGDILVAWYGDMA